MLFEGCELIKDEDYVRDFRVRLRTYLSCMQNSYLYFRFDIFFW